MDGTTVLNTYTHHLQYCTYFPPYTQLHARKDNPDPPKFFDLQYCTVLYSTVATTVAILKPASHPAPRQLSTDPPSILHALPRISPPPDSDRPPSPIAVWCSTVQTDIPSQYTPSPPHTAGNHRRSASAQRILFPSHAHPRSPRHTPAPAFVPRQSGLPTAGTQFMTTSKRSLGGLK